MTDLQKRLDQAAWDIFARHQPYYHVLSDPTMWDPSVEGEARFWQAGEEDVERLKSFADLKGIANRAVDFGCGLGRLTRALGKTARQRIGLDISPEMIEKARALNASFPDIEFRVIRDDSWPVERASCDLAVSLLVLQHLSSDRLIAHSIQEISRVLSPGGRAVFQMVTNRWAGRLLHFLKNGLEYPTQLTSNPQNFSDLRQRLLQTNGPMPSIFSDEEILNGLMQMEFRRIRSFPIGRLKRVMRAAGLRMDRLDREPNGCTTGAATRG